MVAADAHGAVGTAAADARGAVAIGAAAHGAVAIGVAARGAVATGVAAHGMAVIGVAATGAVAIGMAAIGTTGMAATGAVAIGTAATGTTGTVATGTIGTAMISSSLVAWDFRGGGVRAIRMDIMEAIHMVTVTGLATAMAVTRMITVMALATGMAMAASMVTVTAMEMEPTNMAAPAMEMDTATRANPELPSYSAGSLALVIITELSTASWDHRRVKQFAPTSRTATVDPVLFTARDAREGDRKRRSAILSFSTRGERANQSKSRQEHVPECPTLR
jgi:hypothetical protein